MTKLQAAIRALDAEVARRRRVFNIASNVQEGIARSFRINMLDTMAEQ